MSYYGRDISCTDSIRTGRFATGARLVAEAAYRRLTTPRGMLRGGEDEANYGLDLTELIGTSTTKASAAALPGKIAAELSKDERIDASTLDIQVVLTKEGPASVYTISIAGKTANEDSFTLVLLASDVTVELLGLGAT